jgi:hypothetical protein
MKNANGRHSLELEQRLADFPPPTVIDVRRAEAFERDSHVIAGAIRRPPETVLEWAQGIDAGAPSSCIASKVTKSGAMPRTRCASAASTPAIWTAGLEAWRANGGKVVPHAAPSRWVTRERPKIDRIACPWLVRRFIDPAAEFFYVPAAEVRGFADVHGATPFDIPGVQYGHDEERCSFDAFIRIHGIADGALDRLATIVRGADTGVPSLAAESPGLLATSQGPVGDVRGRSRHAARRHDDVRRALPVCRERVHAARFKAA